MTSEGATRLVILSGAYVSDEIAAEYGRLPPSFLPLGGKRLFEYQVALAQGPVTLSLPQDFDPDPVDSTRLQALGVTIVRVPPGLSLVQSLAHVLGQLPGAGALELLHGDTLVRPAARPEGDLVSWRAEPAHYFWAYCTDDEGAAGQPTPAFAEGYGDGSTDRKVLCGHFRFEDAALLAQVLDRASGFVDALNSYARARPFARARVEGWFDFGHLPLFYRSRHDMAVARAFNSVRADGVAVIKRSADTAKMRAEAAWFESLSDDLLVHAPRYLGRSDRDGQAGYRIEYIHQPLVSDLMVFGRLSAPVWQQVLSSCFDFLKLCRTHRPSAEAPESTARHASDIFAALYADKTRQRFGAFATARGLAPDTRLRLDGQALPPLSRVIDDLIAALPPTQPQDICLCHGDFFFGNMFYDFRAGRVVVIDPRGGFVPGHSGLWGDGRYDLAKLAHSVIGAYDAILSGRSTLRRDGPLDWQFTPTDRPLPAGVTEAFLSRAAQDFGMQPRELLAMTALLFLSMLPLHAEAPERQDHFLANALRLARMAGAA